MLHHYADAGGAASMNVLWTMTAQKSEKTSSVPPYKF